MKMNLQRTRSNEKLRRAFTLVEMIGVLAIIAILASLLIPRVFQAIGDAKINNAVASCNSIKAGVNEYYGRYGIISGSKGTTPLIFAGTPPTAEDWDLGTLVADGFIEKPFTTRIGNGKIGSGALGSRLRVINITGNTATTTPLAINGAYNLDGNTNLNDITGSLLIEAVIQDVDFQDAKDFNDRLDGSVLGAALGSNDISGRVKFFVTGGSIGDIRVYLAHR